MTIEEKAKAYDEALKKAKRLYEQGTITESLAYIFPALSQSEDERIRKALIEMVHDTTGDKLWVDYNVHKEEALAWLEKQVYTKKDIDDAYLKGISDAKDELEKQGEQKPTVVDFNAKDWYVSKVDGKIHDMTYNPADKVEPFDKYEGLTNFERTLADICIGWIGEELGWKQYIKDNADVLLKIAIKKFNSIQDAPFKQKPAAWSEEDELIVLSIKQVIQCASSLNLVPEKLDKIDKWLKSLKDRITWKPSKEQIEALDDALNERGFDYNYLNSLYEQLKKF